MLLTRLGSLSILAVLAFAVSLASGNAHAADDMQDRCRASQEAATAAYDGGNARIVARGIQVPAIEVATNTEVVLTALVSDTSKIKAVPSAFASVVLGAFHQIGGVLAFFTEDGPNPEGHRNHFRLAENVQRCLRAAEIGIQVSEVVFEMHRPPRNDGN